MDRAPGTELRLLSPAICGGVKVPSGDDLAADPAFPCQLMQCILAVDIEQSRHVFGEIPARRPVDQRFSSGQQSAEAGEADALMRPESLLVELGDLPQRRVAAAMRVAGEMDRRTGVDSPQAGVGAF